MTEFSSKQNLKKRNQSYRKVSSWIDKKNKN